MRNIFQITKDMRDLAKIATELADEMDQIFAVFTGGPTTPFAPGLSSAKPTNSPSLASSSQSKRKSQRGVHKNSWAGVKATEEQKLLIRQLWFSLPAPQQTLEKKREISRRVGLNPAVVATIIRKTQNADLTNFLKQQAPSGSGARIT